MKLNKKKLSDKSAVSPVVGVVLMVAVTVIMSGIVGSAAFGMTDKLPTPGTFADLVNATEETTDTNTTDGDTTDETTDYALVLTATQTGDNTVDIIYNSGINTNAVDYIRVTIGTDEYTRWETITSAHDSGGSAWLPTFGSDDGMPANTGLVTLNDVLVLGTGIATITPGSDHLIATATFLDGSSQVVLDTHV